MQVKSANPQTAVTFIVPCAIRKVEAEKWMKQMEVDFVLTFEEVMGMLDARGVDLEIIHSKDYEALKHIS